MIRDLIVYLETDGTLYTLLNANAGNSKFFSMRTKLKGEKTPYILYSQPSIGSGDPVLEESIVQLSIVEEDYDKALTIAYRLDELLDVWEGINGKVTSINFYIYYSRKTGGNDSYEDDTKLNNLVRLFHIKYKRKNGG